MPPVRVHVIVDNYAVLPTRLLAEYGFAALVEDLEAGVTILFDTGTTGIPLLNNLELINVDPREIDYIVLSHRHYDHTGGLIRFLEARKGKPIDTIAHPDLFVPAYAYGRDGVLRNIGAPFTELKALELGARFLYTKAPLKVTENIMVSGEIPREWGPSHTEGLLRLENGRLVEDPIRDDQALYIKTDKGLLAVTGCGHAGLENIVETGLRLTGSERLYGIVGGLHALGAKPERLREMVDYLASKKPSLVAAMHCTGPIIQGMLAEKLGNAYRLGGVDLRVEV